MTSRFITGLNVESRKTVTENGANAFNTTNNGLVDLFATIGAMRGQDISRLHVLIESAYNEDPLLLAKMLFQTRDIRGGLGERDVFKQALHYCAIHHEDIVENNIALIPEYGRWDDMFALIGTPLEKKMYDVMHAQLVEDTFAVMNNKTPSPLAKWLPTGDATSERTRTLAKEVAKGLGFPGIKSYKGAYKPIRAYMNVVERQMSNNSWSTIDYEHVPSSAMLKHSPAFRGHDGERYEQYIQDVIAGKKKINASTLYPYDIVEKVLYDGEKGEELNELWKALPNYITESKNYLVMADVSGSMTGRPMATSVGLAMYFAQRNKGDYHNCFMTFSEDPQIVRLTDGAGLVDTVRTIVKSEWGMNTNLEKAFDKILNIAIESQSSQADLPEALIIVTDMEFDMATSDDYGRSKGLSFMDSMRAKFEEHGYVMPNIVFWNVESRHNTFHDNYDRKGIVMVSGQSVSTFKNLMGNLNGKTAYDIMVECLNDERYSAITVRQ